MPKKPDGEEFNSRGFRGFDLDGTIELTPANRVSAMSFDIHSEIQDELGKLGPDAPRSVLRYVRSLKQGDAGTPGTILAEFAGTIPIEDLQVIQSAIELG
jgi:hypothetical protein